jgi:hypothetical protein
LLRPLGLVPPHALYPVRGVVQNLGTIEYVLPDALDHL